MPSTDYADFDYVRAKKEFDGMHFVRIIYWQCTMWAWPFSSDRCAAHIFILWVLACTQCTSYTLCEELSKWKKKSKGICIFIYRFYALVFALIHFRSVALRFTSMAPTVQLFFLHYPWMNKTTTLNANTTKKNNDVTHNSPLNISHGHHLYKLQTEGIDMLTLAIQLI